MSRSLLRPLQAALVTSSLTFAASIAFAQDPVGVPPPPPAEALPPQPAVIEVAPPPAALPPISEPMAPPRTPAIVTPPVTVEAEAPAPVEEAEAPWYNDFSLGVFVDAYGALRSDSNRKRPEPPPGTSLLGQYPHEAYVTGEGFGLAFAGLDAAYSGDKFGATVSLRFGPGVNRFYFGDNGPLGIDNITQAFATWKPTEKLTIDMGQFYTLYGGEVTESWRNLNYTRGALYYAMQPFWHTGVRANLQLHETFALNAMVVNGVNNAFETDKSPTLGIQAVLTPGDVFFLAAGYMAALNPRSGGELPFQNFFDVVATVTAGDFKLIGNFDFNAYKQSGGDGENWWGVSIAPGYAFTDYLGAALRFEYLSDSQNFLFAMTDGAGVVKTDTVSLTTLTATLDIKPVPDSSALVIRPEFRYEMSSDDYFAKSSGAPTDGFWEAVLGVVVTSMP